MKTTLVTEGMYDLILHETVERLNTLLRFGSIEVSNVMNLFTIEIRDSYDLAEFRMGEFVFTFFNFDSDKKEYWVVHMRGTIKSNSPEVKRMAAEVLHKHFEVRRKN